MAFRGWLGPVFAYEWLTAVRCWQMYAGRSIRRPAPAGLTDPSGQGHSHQGWPHLVPGTGGDRKDLFSGAVFIELVMLMLTPPAAAAGAICLDKARGTLLHALRLRPTDAEIVPVSLRKGGSYDRRREACGGE